MREFLLFRLYGPLASWGEVAVGEVRPSELTPSRSALLGLVAAALGLRRSDEEAQRQLTEVLHFAVRTDWGGAPLRDYHTVQTGRAGRKETFFTRRDELRAARVDTLVSQRYYRVEGAWTVVAWLRSADRWTLENLAAALRQPVFVPYLGRKSCPLAWPLEPKVVTAASVVAALEASACARWHAHVKALGRKPSESVLLSWEAGEEAVVGVRPGEVSVRETLRRDQPVSRSGWLFARRRERSSGIVLASPPSTASGKMSCT
jgi:CRISPR system Cascade subunit CasD